MEVKPVELCGRRSMLIPLQKAHAPDLYQAAQYPEIWAWMPENLLEQESVDRWIAQALEAQALGQELPFTIFDRETGHVVGSTRLLDISLPHRSVEIGWTWLSPTVWRTRVNTECKYLLLQHCFETL